MLRFDSLVLVLLALALARPAQGQFVDHRVDGRVLDANNRVGSGGVNSRAPQFRPGAANLYITGNVTGGRAFRGFSPIRDASSLFLSVPSARLSRFIADSAGAGDVVAGRSPSVVSPFYFPSATATSAGGVSTHVAPRAPGTLEQAYRAPRIDLFTGRPLTLAGALNPGGSRPASASPEAGFPLRGPRTTTTLAYGSEALRSFRLAESPLFRQARGWTPHISGTEGLDTAVHAAEKLSRFGPVRRSDPLAPRSELLGRVLDPHAHEPTSLTSTVFESAAGRDLFREAAESSTPSGRASSASPALPPLARPIGGVDPLDAWSGPAGTEMAGGGAPMAYAPGRTLYEDFQEALRWADRSALHAEDPSTPDASLQARQSTETPDTESRVDLTVSYHQRLLDQAPKSFAGSVESDANARVRRAEALVYEGAFYDAADQYTIASTLAPDDPLIRLGIGHAYAAAGDYLSAVFHLSQGLERFPEVARFRIDLYQFVSDPNVLDIRRADLENKLERREDYRLRFLLGYIEHYSGLEEFGLPHLRQAAADAPRGSIIARFPAMLEGATTSPDTDR